MRYQHGLDMNSLPMWQQHTLKLERRIVFHVLRAIACKYGKSDGRSENSDFLLVRQKDPFGKLFSEIYFQSSSEFIFL